MRSYTIFGGGSVGSSLAGYLARAGHPVRLVAREAHVRAIENQGGLRVVAREETFLAPVRAVTSLPEGPFETPIWITVQNPDLPEALAATRNVESPGVVTWQNGIRAEALAAECGLAVWGGVVRYTSTLHAPGEVRLRAPGHLIVGRHPEGADPWSRAMAADLAAAGYRTAVSPRIAEDKALKLLVNLVSGPAVLISRTGREPALARVQTRLLEEANRVLRAAGIVARPASGLGQPVEDLITHFRSGASAPDTRGGVYNSTWQNLHRGRDRLENKTYHGEIVERARTAGLEAPVNARAWELLETVRREELGPEPWEREEFMRRFADVVDFDDLPQDAESDTPKGLEI